ncbi:MAG TPA: hypothetical protein VFK31_01980, partial [Rhodanobacteraceae bacterium]|nr:hypothetical protein [Rhodanobacteraceae bacterium]
MAVELHALELRKDGVADGLGGNTSGIGNEKNRPAAIAVQSHLLMPSIGRVYTCRTRGAVRLVSAPDARENGRLRALRPLMEIVVTELVLWLDQLRMTDL